MPNSNNNNSYEKHVKNNGEQRSNPLNKGVEKQAPSEELKKVLKDELKKD